MTLALPQGYTPPKAENVGSYSMRETVSRPRTIRFGVFEVDLQLSELRKRGVKIKLQEQQCQILGILLEQPGEVVTRERLRRRLWADDTFVDFDHSLNTAMMRLREALGDSSDNPRFIETLPRKGYRFIAPVTEVPEPDLEDRLPEAPERAKAPEPRASSEVVPAALPETAALQPTRLGWRSAAITGFVLLALIGAGLLWRYLRHDRAVVVAPPTTRSIVVLPLENLSGQADQEYFADGMTDALTAQLAKISSLRVISRTSAMQYKGSHKLLSEIARDLNVDAVVEGTVLHSGNRVRITAELVQVSTDRHLWAETYESEMGDILALQSRVAQAIVNEIRINLSPQEKKLLATTRVVSEESYENYLKGRYYWNKRSEDGLTKAIEYFRKATQEEPGYALAYAGMADCYSIIGSAIVDTVPAGEVAPKAKAAALKAIELDDTLAEADTALATVRFNYDWDWAGAANGFKLAIEHNPSYATAYQRYSLYLMAMGRTQESMTEMNRARALDPLSVSMNFSLGWRLYMAHQYDQAIKQLGATIDMDPNFGLAHRVLGESYEQKGLYPEALDELRKAVAISHHSPPMLASLGHAYGVSGRKQNALKIIDQLKEESASRYVSPFYLAVVYAGMGEKNQALESLERAYQDRSNRVVFLKVDPQVDNLRSDPRFQALLQRLALPK